MLSSWDRCSDLATLVVPTRTGWPLRVSLDEVFDDRGELGLLGAVHEVGLVGADHVLVRGDGHDTEVVDLVELDASVIAVPVIPASFS